MSMKLFHVTSCSNLNFDEHVKIIDYLFTALLLVKMLKKRNLLPSNLMLYFVLMLLPACLTFLAATTRQS